jgi:CheY-like chemotaxis protein
MADSSLQYAAGAEPQSTVLVADDENPVRHLLAQVLRQLGCRVLAAADGQEALTLFDSHSSEIDLVVFDLTMPQMDGVELFNCLKQRYPSTKTLLISGHVNQESIDQLQAAGLSAYLRKPFELNEIRQAVTSLIGTG